jgi:hypothetical protein
LVVFDESLASLGGGSRNESHFAQLCICSYHSIAILRKTVGNGAAEGAAGYTTPETGSGDLSSANGMHAAAALQQVDVETQDKEMKDEAVAEDVGGPTEHMMLDNNVLMDDELADSDEDMMDIDDAEEEMVAFVAEQLGVQLDVARAPLTQHPLHPLTSDLLDDTSDDNSKDNASEMSDKYEKLKTSGVGRDEPSTADDSDEAGSTETGICLLTGAVMRSGSARRPFSHLTRPPGACTLHARQVGSGTGISFLVQKCTVLLMHNNKSAYSASL